MQNQIEIEAKVLLNHSQFQKLINNFKNFEKRVMIQTNYYIDSKEFTLRKSKMSLRVRQINNELVLTLKEPIHNNEGTLETDQTISPSEFKKIKKNFGIPNGPIKEKFKRFNNLNLIVICYLKTKRIEINYLDGLLCLDKNKYFKKVDYELEFEDKSISEAKRKVSELLAKLKIEAKFNKISKVKRAFKEMEEFRKKSLENI